MTRDKAKKPSASGWLLLILTLPGRQATLRVRVWRKLKILGVGVLRDGVYVVPNRPDLREVLTSQAEEIVAAGGAAQMLEVKVHHADFRMLFDRRPEYVELAKDIKQVSGSLQKASLVALERDVDRLRKDFEGIVRRDYFPDDAQQRSLQALDELGRRVDRRRTPDEPHAAKRRVSKMDSSEYRDRTWATRQRPWVDRLASAWLIKRFIDPRARIKWLKNPADAPRAAIGFDFDGAAFTHVDGMVTFEVLIRSFSLAADEGLQKIAAIVHYLDVGGLPVPEANPIEAVLRGIRDRIRTDDEFLVQAEVLFDDLYAGYSVKQPSP